VIEDIDTGLLTGFVEMTTAQKLLQKNALTCAKSLVKS